MARRVRTWAATNANMTTAKPDARQLVQLLRERTGLTQEKFAARLGVSFPTINRREKGHAKPSPLALKQLEALLRELGDHGVDLLRHYFGAPDPSSPKAAMNPELWSGNQPAKTSHSGAKQWHASPAGRQWVRATPV